MSKLVGKKEVAIRDLSGNTSARHEVADPVLLVFFEVDEFCEN